MMMPNFLTYNGLILDEIYVSLLS